LEAGLVQEEYNLPVYPVLENILSPPEALTICDHFESSIFGLEARQDYRVINLWQFENLFEKALIAL
jgi:hypothetical protein